MASRLEALGVSRAGKGEIADLCYVNTCSVTEVADHKCRQAIHRLIKQHPGAFVVVTGCYAQLKPDVVKKIEGVDLVLGTAEKGRAVEMIVKGLSSSPSLLGRGADTLAAEEDNVNTPLPSKDGQGRTPFVPSCSCGERTRYFLKVQDGCDYFCTYCTIPFARGRSRNGTIASLVAQAEEVAQKGGKEIVLTGVNIGDFGKIALLNELQKQGLSIGVNWYRTESLPFEIESNGSYKQNDGRYCISPDLRECDPDLADKLISHSFTFDISPAMGLPDKLYSLPYCDRRLRVHIQV